MSTEKGIIHVHGILSSIGLFLGIFLVLGWFPASTDGALKKYTCNAQKNEAVIQPSAQAFLIGLFSFHQKGGMTNGCGEPRTASMQAYEAIRYTLDLLNKKGEKINGQFLSDFYVPGIRIGMLARDYCDQKPLATAALQDAINDIESTNCASQAPPNNPKLLLGVIGASTDEATLAIADYTTKHRLPLVSYISTTHKLSDNQKYPYVMRTVPSDKSLLGVLVEVLQKLNWNFVTVVYTDDIGGMDSFMELRERVTGKGICLTTGVAMSSTDTSDATMKKVLDQVKSKGTTGVIYLGTGTVLQSLFNTANNHPGAADLQWIVTSSLSLANTFPNNKYPRGVVAVLTGSRFIVEFEDHWKRINESSPSTENPWFQEWYMNYRKCRLPGVTQAPFNSYPNCVQLSEAEKRRQFVQDQSVEPAIHAVFTYARALRMAQADKCGATPGMCSALAAMPRTEFVEKYLKKVQFTYQTGERIASLASSLYAPYKKAKELNFDSNGDVINPEFGIWNFNNYSGPGATGFRFRNVGSYSNGRLSFEMSKVIMYGPNRMTKLSSLPSSSCGLPMCYPCLNSYPERKYLYKPGDIVINGFFSIHKSGITPHSCGAFNSKDSQVQLLEAMSFASNDIKTRYPNLLPGVKLGIIGLDDCSMSTTALGQISDIQHGQMKIIDHTTGVPLLPWSVSGYVGLSHNEQTEPVAEAMNTWKRPLVGYVQAGTKLTQTEKYPYYLSTLPSVEQMMMVLSRVLKELNIKYIQVVESDDDYGHVGMAVLLQEAAKFGICLVSCYRVNPQTTGAQIINELRKIPHVKPTIVIMPTKDIHKLLEGVRSTGAGGEFDFIGLETWGTLEHVVEPFKVEANGALTIKHRTPPMADFMRHLQSLDLTRDKTNPWLAEWWQSLYHCAFQSVNTGGFATICNTSVASYQITSAPNFVLDPQAAPVINAVYAFAHGLHALLTEMCGNGYNGVCSEFFTSRFTGKYLVEKMKEASFRDAGGDLFSFDKEGYGSITYDIFNYYGGKYTQVGSYNVVSGSLQLSSIRLYGDAPLSVLESTCPDQCVLCQYLLGFRPFLYIPGNLLLPAVFDIHSKGDSPFACGDIRLHGGFQNAEAMTFALELINSGRFSALKAHNVSLGALGFDGCSTPEQAKAHTYALHNGMFNPKYIGLQNLSPSKLQSWLSYDSGSTIAMSSILSPLDVMLVSPGATSPALLDKNTYSTFFRTMPSDMQVIRAMAKLVKELGFSYIITLNAPDVGSRDSVQLFRLTIEGLGVCIASSLEFGTDGSPDNIVYDITDSSTRVVVVFAEYGQDIENLLIAKQKLPAGKNIVFITNRNWYLPSSLSNNVIDKSIMFQKDFPIINEFKQWLIRKTPATRDKANPWFVEYFEKIYGCSIGVNCQSTQSVVDPRFVQDTGVVPTIDAVFAVAIALQKTLEEKCGSTYMGVCNKFLSDVDTKKRLMAHMDAVQMKTIYNEDFKFINRERSVQIMVKRISNGTVDYIATYANDTLTYYTNQEAVARGYERVPSKCLTQCGKCEGKKSSEEFIFNPGDFLLVGLFDVHKKGATPYTCGAINNKQGFQLVEAFNYAINYVNSGQGIFSQIMRGVTLGSLSLDVCQSPLRAANLVSNLHSQTVHLFGNATNKIDPDDFEVYIGPLKSDSSIRVADVLNQLGVPQISYGATSVELRNEKYPFFLRTVPADDKQARAMIAYLKSFSITHVQVLSSNDTVGRHGMEEFAKLAFVNKICIVQNITLAQDGALTQQEADKGVNKLLTYQKSNAVIVFMTNPRLILLAAEKNKMVAGNYLFLVTDKWGYDLEMLDGLDDLLKYRHVVIFDIETADLPGFDMYLDKKTPISNVNNPWFNEYYQLIYDCSLGAPTSQYTKQCSGINYKTIPRAKSYVQDPYVLYVVNAVFSAAIGIHKTLQSVCGTNYRGICLDYLNGGDQKQKILQGIKDAKFEDATQQEFFFVENTFESDRGYHIYEPILESTIGAKRYRYDNVGSYNDTHYLKIDARYKQTWRTSCPDMNCPKCEFPPYHPSRFMAKKSPFYLNIVAVMGIHQMDSSDPEKCGPLDWPYGFQNLLAFFYAIDNVNKNDLFKLSNSLQLGGVAIDTCSNPDKIGQDIYSLLSGEGLCGPGGNDKMIIPPATIVAFMPTNSAHSTSVAEIASPYSLTTLSQSATSAKLSNKGIYPYFLRTVPPDNIQALVMANVLKQMQWSYVSFVYSDDAYGQAGYAEFLRQSQSKEKGFCLATAKAMPMDADINQARKIVQQLNQKAGARVVVLFVTQNQIRLLLQAAEDLKLTRRFVWLGSDTWADSPYAVKGLEKVAAGAITVQIRSMEIEGYKKYVKSLTLTNHAPIPDDWFEEFYQDIHQCRILRSAVQKNYNRLCTGDEKMTDNMLATDPYVFQTILAVDMIALGLNNIKKCRKNNALSVAACLALQPERNKLIYESILKSQWSQINKDGVGIPDDFQFRFTDSGFGDIGYDILNYRYNLTTNMYEYQKIGSWINDLSLTMSKYRGGGYGDNFLIPRSYCSISGTCNCLNADGRSVEYRPNGQASALISDGQEILIDPNTGVVVNLNDRPTAYNRFSQIGGTIITTLAALGTFFAICLFCYFLIFFPFRGSTTILGFTLLFAIIFLYLLAIAFVAHATPVVCSIRRFFLGFFYSLAYSALFIKLLDAYRNKKKEQLVYKKLSRPCGLLMSCLLLVGVQSIINIEWLILIPPEVVSVPYEGVMWPRCAPSETSDEALVMSLIFVMCILALCLLFGLCSWGSKNNCYEARWIFGMALLSILVWIVWCLVSIVGSYSVRDTAVAVGLLINASILLVLGPIRRLRLLKEYKQKEKGERPDYYLYDSDLNSSVDYSQSYNVAPQLRIPDDVHY